MTPDVSAVICARPDSTIVRLADSSKVSATLKGSTSLPLSTDKEVPAVMSFRSRSEPCTFLILQSTIKTQNPEDPSPALPRTPITYCKINSYGDQERNTQNTISQT
ncbi:hypothetical protein PGTUg99_025437 [Puccinia graminis f. sp. tritici]|uniref:Uncharacterized protein n=1 Tax=Puccinia graminis f. sp. tritici TaxID=56615 RepID=A0A5B0QUB1_PUCGR|nr:hypothetical protein PGTUg99_025437 [Puccinia graminis f. sp. tritici]